MQLKGQLQVSFSHTESRLVTAETELTKERENNRLKIGRLENTIERMGEELKMKSAEAAQLANQLDLSQQRAVAGHPAIGEYIEANQLAYELNFFFVAEQVNHLKAENATIIERFNGQSADLVRISTQLNSLADERNYLDNECQRLNSLLMNFHNESRSFSLFTRF